MAITGEQFAEAVVKAIPGFFNDAIDQLRVGEGAYIRDGEPSGIVAQIGQAVARSACRRYGAQGPEAVGSKGERFERACRPYLDSLSPGLGLGYDVPFDGGQCGAPYRVVAQRTNGAGDQILANAVALQGPLGGTRVIGAPLSGLSFQIFAQGNRTANSGTCGVLGTGGPKFYNLITIVTNQDPPPKFSVASITPCTGSANNCGDPPSQIIDPTNRPDPNPPPFVFSPAPGINIPINVEINNDGTIGFDFGEGPRTVDPFPPDNPGGGGGGGDPGDPTDPGSPGVGGDTGSGGEADGNAGPGEELVGLLVQVLEAPQGANTFANNTQAPFRGIGYVRMGYPGRLGLDISGGTVISPQFFHAPQRGLTNWAVSANLGFNLRTTPYYREITS